MTYSFLPHIGAIIPDDGEAPQNGHRGASGSYFALVDGAQRAGLVNECRKVAPGPAPAYVFEDNFANGAVELSPALFQLNSTSSACHQEVLALDAICSPLPALTLLQTPLTRRQLLRHLRALMLVEADGTPYLWRFADSLMLLALNSVLLPEQRARAFAEIDAWWAVNHDGEMSNVADPAIYPQTAPPSALPPATSLLTLDEAQMNALLVATSVPMLAGQLRHLDPDYTRTLSHFEQLRFAADCLDSARAAALDVDADLASWALTRWNERNTQGSPL